MPDPAKAGPLFAKLDTLAPYPPDDATAPQVARWLAAQGMLTAARSQGGRDAFPPSPDHAHLLGAQFTAAFFLQGMTELAEAMTDPVAGRTIEAAADIMAVAAVAVWNGGDFAAPLRNLLGAGAEAAAAAADDLAEAMAGAEPEPASLNSAEPVTVSAAEREACATEIRRKADEHESCVHPDPVFQRAHLAGMREAARFILAGENPPCVSADVQDGIAAGEATAP
jgi:hypothetical protein